MRSIGALLFFLLPCLMAEEFFYQQAEHISLREGEVSISRLSRDTFKEDISLENWRLCYNRDDALSCYPNVKDGRAGLLLRRRPSSTVHAAFELRSIAFPVTAEADFSLRLIASGTFNLEEAVQAVIDENMPKWQPLANDESDGFFGKQKKQVKCSVEEEPSHQPVACRRGVRWLNSKGAEIGMTPLVVHRVQENMFVLTAEGSIPPKCEYAQILIGAAAPDFAADSYLMLYDVLFKSMDGRLYPSATFISQPFPMQKLGSILSWKADTPGKTAVFVQLSSCEDATAGEWMPFCGEGLDPQRAFARSGNPLPAFPPMHRWLRYKVMLRGDGKRTPTLKSITVGEHAEANWVGAEMAPPVITLKSSARQSDAKATLAFAIHDDSSVEWHSVELKADGKDVSGDCHRVGNILYYVPQKPFTSEKRQFEKISDWDFSNRESLLNCTITDEGRGMRIDRRGDMAATAFNLVSPEAAVLPNEKYTFSCEVRSNLNFSEKIEPNLHLAFLDKDGRLAGKPVQLSFAEAGEWCRVECSAVAPANAAIAIVRISVLEQVIYDERFIEIRKPSLAGKMKDERHPNINMHTFTVIASDMSGNTGRRSFDIFFCPGEPSSAALSEAGEFSWRGTQFKPLGIAGRAAAEAAGAEWDKLQRRGFNFMLAQGSYEELEQYAKNAVLKRQLLFVALQGREHAELLEEVALLQNLPNIAALVMDESILEKMNPGDFAKLTEIIRGIAPGQLLAIKGRLADDKLAEYIPQLDFFMPVIDEEVNIAQLFAQAGKLGISHLLPLLHIRNGSANWLKRECTILLSGGRGLLLECDFPQAVQWLLPQGTRLQELMEIASAKQEAGETSRCKLHSGTNVLAYFCKYDEHQYVVFCNGGPEDASATFYSEKCDEAKSLLDDVAIPVEKGRFSDTIASGELRIYKLMELFE